MNKLLMSAAVFLATVSSANAAEMTNGQKTEAIENMGTVVAAMRKCDNLTISPNALKVITSSLTMLGVDTETVNTPTVTFMLSQATFEGNYSKDPGMTCKLAKAKFPKVLDYAR